MRLLMRPAGVLTGEALLDGGAGVLWLMTVFALDLRDACPAAAVFLAAVVALPILRADTDENGEDEAEAPPETRDLRLMCTSEFSKAFGDGLGARPE